MLLCKASFEESRERPVTDRDHDRQLKERKSFYTGIQANGKVSFHSLNGGKKHMPLLRACSRQ